MIKVSLFWRRTCTYVTRMRKSFLGFIIVVANLYTLPSLGAEATLNDFTSDGCSLFPDSDWRICCEIHDIDYWAGIGGLEGKEESDHNLHQCLSQKDDIFMSWLIPFGVRIAEPINFTEMSATPFRWGYGWNTVLGKRDLSIGYRSIVERKLGSIMPGIEQGRSKDEYPDLDPRERQKIQMKINQLRLGLQNR